MTLLFRMIRRTYSSNLLGNAYFNTFQDRFDGVLQKIDILKCNEGSCSAVLKIDTEHTNPMGNLHGGLSATLVDCVSSLALFSHPKNEYSKSVSVNINLSYMKGAAEGEEVVIEAKTLRVGKTLAYLTCDITNKKNGDLLVQGTHTKYIMRNQ